MEKIPPEIFSQIVKNLDAPLAPYSTISRDWQCHIESRTMAEIHVRSDDASWIDRIFQDPRRRALLKVLTYEIILPTYNPKRWSKVPGRRECLKNNVVFTKELRDLFTKLYTYDKVEDSAAFHLWLRVSCPPDTYDPPWNTQGQTDGTGPNRNNNTYIYLDPVDQEPLPVLTRVVRFSAGWSRNLHSGILGVVLRSIPAVEYVYWHFDGPEVRLLDLRRGLRTSLAQILLSTSLSSLRELRLSWDDASCSNQSFDPGSVLNPDTGVDDLSMALRRIAQLPTIKIITLGTAFLLSPDFFNFGGTDANSPISWPSLQILNLQLSSMTPAGDWYTTGDPNLARMGEERGTPSDDEGVNSADSEFEDYPPTRMWKVLNGNEPLNSWRTQPGAAYNSFLLAIANAIAYMPSLRRLSCQMGYQDSHCLATKVEYLAAGEVSRVFGFRTNPWEQRERRVYDWPHWEIVLEQENSDDDEQTVWEIPEELKQALRYNTGSHGSINIVNQDIRTELGRR